MALLGLIAQFTGVPLPSVSQPSWSEQVLIFIFISYIAYLIQSTFRQWNGEISVNQYEQQKRQEIVFFAYEGILEMQRKIKGEKLSIYTPIEYNKTQSALEVPSDSLAWRIQAIELLSLRWHGYYRFDSENDENWHEKANCWLGKNIKENKVTSVYVCRQEPNLAEIKNFIEYVDLLGNDLNNCELIIITKESTAIKTHWVDSKLEIKQYCEDCLLDGLVNFEDYFSDLKRRVEFECLPDSDLKLSDIYVPSLLSDDENKVLTEDLENYLSKWLVEIGQRHLAILGEYGQGKSTGMLMFSHHLTQQLKGNLSRIPILIELRGKSPKTLQPLELLSVWGSNYRIEPKALMKLHQAGRLLMIFEGFDEMAEVSDSEARFSHFRSLWQFCYPKAKILITGRPNFFLDDRELKALLGVDRSTATGAYVQALNLQPFSMAQIESSLRHIDTQSRQEICHLATMDTKFHEIVARPSLLYIVSQLWQKELRMRQQDVNSALVMDLFIQHSYKRQTEKIRDGRQFMVLSESERSYFMDGIAAYMAKEKLPNQITLENFNQIVEKLYAIIPDEVSLVNTALSGITIKPLKLRLRDNDDPLEAVKTDVRTCGILVKDLTRANSLKFPHKSFLEFLFASFSVQRLINKNNVSAAAIWKVTQAEPKDLLYMLESLEFTAELLRYNEQVKYDINDKSKLEVCLFNIVNQGGFRLKRNYLYRYILIISRLTHSKSENIIRSVLENVQFKILFVSISFLSFILIMFAQKIDPFSMVERYKKFPLLILFISSIYTTTLIFWMQGRNNKEVSLWFLLSVILEIDSNCFTKSYGKKIASSMPRLAKEYSAEYLLEKYRYFKSI
jgi:hypothetical protein